eukprot:jgi/Botrbrau1/5407/Bobra.182_1s0011.1
MACRELRQPNVVYAQASVTPPPLPPTLPPFLSPPFEAPCGQVSCVSQVPGIRMSLQLWFVMTW